MGHPRRWNRRRRRPNKRNCRSRSGSLFPPSRLRLERNEYFSARSRRATVAWLTCTPRPRKAAANLRVLLCVQRRHPTGSPAVASRNNSFNHSRTRGVFFRHAFVHGVAQLREGRRVGNRLRISEVLSEYAQRKKGFAVDRPWGRSPVSNG